MSEDDLPTIRSLAEAEAYADTLETRVDRAVGYITRVQELEQLNAAQAEIVEAQRLELLSMKELLENCTQENLRFQQQIASMQETIDELDDR